MVIPINQEIFNKIRVKVAPNLSETERIKIRRATTRHFEKRSILMRLKSYKTYSEVLDSSSFLRK